MLLSTIFSRRSGRSILRVLWHRWHRHTSRPRIHALRGAYKIRLRTILYFKNTIASVSRARQAKIYVDGQKAFARIERLIRRCRHTVLIQMFIWKDDATGRRIAAALLSAADRGVRVEITKDATGDFFELNHALLGTRDDSQGVWERFWHHPNITVTVANDYDHTKAYVIDGHTLLFGGMNIGDEYVNRWHDYLVELKGEEYVRQFLAPTMWTPGSEHVRIIINRPGYMSIRPALEWVLESARKSIVAEHAYVSDERIMEILARKSREGIAVSIILPQRPDLHHLRNQASIGMLLKHGRKGRMRIYAYPGMHHGKLVLVDRSKAFIGSANLMQSSLDEMGEINVLLQGRLLPAVSTVREALREDLSLSTPVLRPPSLTVLGRFFGWVGL